MTVFKYYFKIVRQHLGFILMYSMIAIGISLVNTTYSSSTEYLDTKSKVGIINEDKSLLIDNFIEYLDKKMTITKINNDKLEIQDALYDNKVDAIIIIPNNFTKDFLSGLLQNIEIKKSVENLSTTIELMTNKYFQISNIYSKAGMSEEEIIKRINKDIEKEIEVEISDKKNTSEISKLAIFYSFENYSFLSIFIFIIGTIMCIFNKENIQKRNNISSYSTKKITKELYLSHICLTLTIWLIYIIVSIILYKELMFNLKGLFLIINSLIFAITCTSIAFLIGNLIKNKNVISGIQNILALGSSFISGCFITSDLLDKNIVNISKIFPSYWFINNNYQIVKISTYNFESLKPILINYLIVLTFGIIYLIISFTVSKKKSKLNI